jgi:hypothetical protein
MACVRDEAAFTRERGFEASEHAVQGLGEAAGLVVRRRNLEPAAWLGRRDGFRFPSHRLHRA